MMSGFSIAYFLEFQWWGGYLGDLWVWWVWMWAKNRLPDGYFRQAGREYHFFFLSDFKSGSPRVAFLIFQNKYHTYQSAHHPNFFSTPVFQLKAERRIVIFYVPNQITSGYLRIQLFLYFSYKSLLRRFTDFKLSVWELTLTKSSP